MVELLFVVALVEAAIIVGMWVANAGIPELKGRIRGLERKLTAYCPHINWTRYRMDEEFSNDPCIRSWQRAHRDHWLEKEIGQ